MFRFQAARNMLPGARKRPCKLSMGHSRGRTRRSPKARMRFGTCVPSPSSGRSGLLLTAAGQELAGSQDGNGDSPNFSVTVEGERQTVSPILQDEVYRIAREVLRNAFRHARARQIEAEIRYDDRLLRLRIRDDGKGVDPEVLKKGGRDGHWGLAGIRERAERFGARVDFWSEAGAGTEVQLTVPASVAYASTSRSPPSWFSGERSCDRTLIHRLRRFHRLKKQETASFFLLW